MKNIELMLVLLVILFIGYGAIFHPTFVEAMGLSLWAVICYLFLDNQIKTNDID